MKDLWVCALLALMGTCAHAQSPSRSVRPAVQPAAPAVSPGVAAPGLPSPSGLPSPGFPAGLPSPLPHPAGLPPLTTPNLASPGTQPLSPPIDQGVAPSGNVMGAGGYVGGARAGGQPGGSGSGPYTALQIAQSFIGADANRDGELTRAEAQRLTIMPYSFEEMDRNHDGILTRSEYEDGVR